MLETVIQSTSTVVANKFKCKGGSVYMMDNLLGHVLKEAKDLMKFGKAKDVVRIPDRMNMK